METKEMTCDIIEGAVQDAIDNLEHARECMTAWTWRYVSPEEIDGAIETLRKIIGRVDLELQGPD